MANILAVDDETAILTMIQKILSRDGHQVTVVSDSQMLEAVHNVHGVPCADALLSWPEAKVRCFPENRYMKMYLDMTGKAMTLLLLRILKIFE